LNHRGTEDIKRVATKLHERTRKTMRVQCGEWVISHFVVREGGEWASCYLRSRPGCGELVMNTTYGVYGYYWGATGERAFEDFLTQCDNDYLLSKFCQGEHELYAEQTHKRMRAWVIEDRRSGALKKELARELWDWLEALGDGFNDIELARELEQDDEAYKFFVNEHGAEFVYDFPRQAVYFMGRLWKPIVAAMQREAAAEAVEVKAAV
jgi:hypothetical protein